MATYREKENRWAHDKRIPGTKKKVTGYGPTEQDAIDDAESKLLEKTTTQPSSGSEKPDRWTMQDVVSRIWYPALCIKLGKDSDTVRRYLGNWNYYIAPFHAVRDKEGNIIGSRPLDEIQREDCIAFIAHLQTVKQRNKTGKEHPTKLLSNNSIRGIASVQHQILEAAFLGRKLTYNPAAKIPVPDRPEKRERALTIAQTQDLLLSVEKTDLSLPVFLAVVLGLREGECAGLKWARDFDRQKRTLSITLQAKNPKEGTGLREKKLKSKASRRTLILTPWMVDEIDRRGNLDCPWMCSRKGSYYRPADIYRDWTNWAPSRGFSGWTFHDLRHAAAACLNESGSVMTTMAVLGHAKPDMTAEYDHVQQTRVAQALSSLSEALERGRQNET